MPITNPCTCGQSIDGRCHPAIDGCEQLFLLERDNGYEDNIEPIKEIDMEEKKYIKATEVNDFDHQLYIGDTIKVYGKETEITGFSAQYNDALSKWETIIHTIGRGDPFERTLSDIEVLEEQPRSHEQRAAQMFHQGRQPGAVWVKASSRFPVLKHVFAKKYISYLKKEVVGTASSATGEMICFDWGASSICLAVGHEELNDLEWLDESAAGREEDAVEFGTWIRLNWMPTENGWVDSLGKFETTVGLYLLFKQQKEN